ncbi:MAG: hypothetical protein L6R40_000007 [Gallowayella cf. fulva]|nr:MAG: hypothetical protein L6R40_000007 [Xanthomendoza cf. fulva]
MVEQKWSRDSPELAHGSGFANEMISPTTTTAAIPRMSTPQAQEVTHPAWPKAHGYPEFLNERHSTPMNVASEASQLISALDTESFYDEPNRRMDHNSHPGGSQPLAEDGHDDRYSTSDRKSSRRGSASGSWSRGSSGTSALADGSDGDGFPHTRTAADAGYNDGVRTQAERQNGQ